MSARTVDDGVYHTPLGRFSMVDIPTVGKVPVPKTSRRWKHLAESVPKIRVDTLLVVEQSSSENRPRGV